MVEERQPRLDRVRHRVAVAVAQERREADGEVVQHLRRELVARPRRRQRRGEARRDLGAAVQPVGVAAQRLRLLQRSLHGAGQRPEPGAQRRPRERAERRVAAGRARLARPVAHAPAADELRQERRELLRVAADHLVAALAVERHRHALGAREAVDAPLRVDARAAERLLLVPQQPVEVGDELGARRDDVVRLRAARARDRGDVAALRRRADRPGSARRTSSAPTAPPSVAPPRISSATVQTIADESSPPLRHVPTGTSLTRRRLVASVKSSANRSSAPSPLAFATGTLVPAHLGRRASGRDAQQMAGRQRADAAEERLRACGRRSRARGSRRRRRRSPPARPRRARAAP